MDGSRIRTNIKVTLLEIYSVSLIFSNSKVFFFLVGYYRHLNRDSRCMVPSRLVLREDGDRDIIT